MLTNIYSKFWFWLSFSEVNQLADVTIFLSQTRAVTPVRLPIEFCMLHCAVKPKVLQEVHQTQILTVQNLLHLLVFQLGWYY